jgi:putative glutamine amidotransferase
MKAARPIGLTQRMIAAPPHGELRDCLAVGWYPFLRALGLPWFVLPNETGMALEMAELFGLGGLILTGGEDIGVFPRRDETELALLDFAAREKLPVFGVCRGFQMICHWLDGELSAVDPEIHRGRRHVVHFAEGPGREVNSYHNFAPESLPPGLQPLAYCAADKSVEAAAGELLLGVMWHPEREGTPAREDLRLFLEHFRGIR